MKPWLLFALAFLSASALVARAVPAALPTVAVYDFRTGAPRDRAGYGKEVTTLVTASLAADTNLVMIERAQLNKALQEQAFGASGLVSADTAAKIGQMTGAKILVTGQVIQTERAHLVIIANVIGTETGRLFAAQVQGGNNDLMSLASDLSQKISQTISDQVTNLVAPPELSHDERVDQMVQSVTGTNRPSVSVLIHRPVTRILAPVAETEFGAILLKAGFKVVDGQSDTKPDLEITGVDDISPSAPKNDFFTYHAVIDLTVRRRLTGELLAFEHGEASGTDTSKSGAGRATEVNAVDVVAAKILPLLGEGHGP